MKYKNRLVRDNVAGLLEDKGFVVNKEKFDTNKYKTNLYSLFLLQVKESKAIESSDTKSKQHLEEIYAEMLEIIRTIAKVEKIPSTDINFNKTTSPADWYKKLMPKKLQLKLAQANLLDKFNELLIIKNKEVKTTQLQEIVTGFKEVLNAHEIGFNQVELKRRDMFKKLGGYSQGVYIKGVSKSVTRQV